MFEREARVKYFAVFDDISEFIIILECAVTSSE